MPVVWSSPCAVSFTSQLNVAAATQQGLPLQRSYSSRAGNVAFQKLRIKASAELAEPRRRIACAERLHEKASSSRPLLNAKSEEGLFQILRKEVEAKNLSSSVIAALEELYRNYYNAVAESGISNAKEIVVSNMATAFDRMLIQFEDPFTFSSYHRAIREPFDYYMFGQNYIRPLIDFRNSYVGNLAVFNKIESQLRQGENIVLTSNHQTEADPAVISLLLEKTHPFIAENIIYVAGDRVIHDPVCKPFSMGRNLLCVYSKKHINDDPELAEKKKKANTRTLKEMTLLLRKGGQIIWIAPSGGRDRPNPDTKDWLPDPFDDTAVDNMRRLMEYSGVPGHMHPLSLLCYEVMPPPLKVEKEIGEKRRIGYHGVGISVAPEMKFSNFSTACDDSNKAKKDFSKSLYEMVLLHYKVLQEAIYSGKGMSASNSLVSLSQPWEFPSSISIQSEL